MFIGFPLLRCFTLIRFDLHARAVSQFLKRFLEINPILLHHELEDVAALIAFAETTPRPCLRPDDKSRRMLVDVEWTKAGVVPAGFAQFDTGLGNEVN